MPVTTVIDINFFYGRRRRGIEIEDRIVVPLGNRIVWRFIAFGDEIGRSPLYLSLKVELYFEKESPFPWQTKNMSYEHEGNQPFPFAAPIASEMAESEGEYKYGVRVGGEGTNERIYYDEDPYLIIKRI